MLRNTAPARELSAAARRTAASPLASVTMTKPRIEPSAVSIGPPTLTSPSPAADIHRRFGREAIPHYVISKCQSVSDLLEVGVLLKEVGLARGNTLALDIVPLFETIDDLDRASRTLDAALAIPLYRAWVTSRGASSTRRRAWSPRARAGTVLAAPRRSPR